MEVLYTHSPKMPGSSSKVPNFYFYLFKKFERTDSAGGPLAIQLLVGDRCSLINSQGLGAGQQPTVADRPRRKPPFLCSCDLIFQTFAPFLGHMWSTLSHWFQQMPALPKLLLRTSNIHNFWSVAPKIMKFVLTWSLFWDAFGDKKKF
jgi:hypothetical protein